MRRGLLSWSHDELPPAVLENLVKQVGQRAKAKGLVGVAIYGDSARPAALTRLTNLIPSWSGSYLFVTAAGKAELIIGNGGKRGIPFMREVARFDTVHPTGNFGNMMAERIKNQTTAANPKVGVVELEGFPSGAVAAMRKQIPGIELVEATDLVYDPSDDDSAIGRLGLKSAQIAHDAVEAGIKAASAGKTSPVVAAVDSLARLGGAEDTFISLAPDALADPRLRRIEGDADLGSVITVQISMAYKGQWVRHARTVAVKGAEPAWMGPVGKWFESLAANPGLATDAAGTVNAAAKSLPAGAEIEYWRIEGPKGTLPLAPLVGSPPLTGGKVSLRGVNTLSVRIKTANGSWTAAEPVLLGASAAKKAA